jgi:SAM-dependent methyltransferase
MALDVGCGAGISVRAIESWARKAVGVEPSYAMLRHAGVGSFVAGLAERLLFSKAVFDLVSAAGSLKGERFARTIAIPVDDGVLGAAELFALPVDAIQIPNQVLGFFGGIGGGQRRGGEGR